MEEKAIDNNEEVPLRQKYGVSGLGGWLIVIQIGLYLTILLLGKQVYDLFPVFTDPKVWNMLTSEGSIFYHPLWKPTLIFEIIFLCLFLILGIVALIIMYCKKSGFPKLMIGLYIGNLIFQIVDTILASQNEIMTQFYPGNLWGDVVRAGIVCAIWIPYLIKSDRVANTFVK
ncbi:DUF2569 domain-containing protein [Paenibacillus agilis]|uniref:DUF2569 domain-containing protein n=1 Tax=Paenibacillus agilis TaxID=3020863 RepID=A0A559IWV2_9BACL|nr:DUF2569 domain-containing protein [Paenibacillus agilis]TVX92071.1 DUF2569 domain-containing protein [Paenibacillus agilis]